MASQMFRSTVNHTDGCTSEGTCSEAHAADMIRKAVQRGYRVEATRQGGAVIIRSIPSSGDTRQPARTHTVTLEPVTSAGKVTTTMRHDLAIIARGNAKLLQTGRINAGHIYAIPPAASARLINRGLVTVEGDAVTVSLAAQLAMLAQDHQTSTQEPRGYARPSEIGLNASGVERKGNKIYDRTSVASCPCRWSYPAGDRDSARRKAHEHQQEVTAAMIRAL